MKPRAATRGLALAVLTLGCACARSDPRYYGTTEPLHGPDEIWTNLSAEPEYIDPGKASDSAGGEVITNLFAGLVQAHPQTLEAMPDIADRWSVSEGGRRYTFHLRHSVWSDGTPLTASDFEYAWKRVLDPATDSKYNTFLYPLRYAEMFSRRALLVRGVGAADEGPLREAVVKLAVVDTMRMAPELGAAFVLLGGDDATRAAQRLRVIAALNGSSLRGVPLQVSVTDASVVGVHAVDSQTLVVDFEDPLPYFLDLVKFHVAMPVPRHVLERLVKAGKNPDLWTRPEYIVSNGAYVLGAAKFRQFMRFDRNVHYWDVAHVRTAHIKLLLVESYNTTLNMYEAGELDNIGSNANLPSEFMDRLERYRDFHRAPLMSTYLYWLNVKEPPLDDVRVRQALRLAIDRKVLVDRVTRGGQTPSADLVPDGLAGYTGPHTPSFDPARARALLVEAGYGPKHPLPTITLTYNTSEGHKQLAEAVQQMWRTALGVRVQIENQEWKVFLKNLEGMNFQVARMGWVGDYPDPYTFLELLRSGNNNNHSHWSDARYDGLLRGANLATDRDTRMALFQQAENLIADAAPIIPVYVYTRSELTKPYVMGHALNYENRYLFKYWWIDRRWYRGVPERRLPDGFPPSKVRPSVEVAP